MTVSSTTNRASASGNGVTTAFSTGFYFIDNADLRVSIIGSDGVETVKTITTHYTVAGSGNAAGGTVTFLTAPASGETVLIVRSPSLVQPLDFSDNPRYSPEAVEKHFDRIAMQLQRASERIDRTIQLPTAASAQSDVGNVAARSNKIVGFDGSGNVAAYTRGGEVGAGEIGSIELADGAVTNAKLADMAEATFKMRAAGAGPGAPIDGTVTQAQTALALPTNTVTSLAGKSPTITDQTAVGTLATGDELLVWDISVPGFRKATVAEVLALGGATGEISPYEISGLEVTRFDANTFQIQPGGAANSTNDPTEMLRHTTTTNVVLTSTGLNKLDTGTIANYDECYIYLIKNLTTGVVGFVVSKSISYGGVVYPSGYGAAKSRKLRWGIVYRSIGIPSFHYFNGLTHFTDPDVEGGYFWPDGAYNVDTAGSWTTIDLKPASGTKILPDNSRMAILWARVDYVSSAGRAYVRTPSTSGAGKTVGYVTTNIARVFTGDFIMQTNSTGQIQIKTDSGVKIWISVVGYLQSEYS